jgi:predicted DNA-binding transcriptional regulator YafY
MSLSDYYSSNEEHEAGQPVSEKERFCMVERLIRLISLLSVRTCTRREILEHLRDFYCIGSFPDEQTPRAAYRRLERDLRMLQQVGYEIQKIRGGNKPTLYKLINGSGPYTPRLFSEQEVDILALLYTMFTDPTRHAPVDPQQPLPMPQRPPFADEILHCIKQLADGFSPDQRRRFDRRAGRPYIYFNIAPVTDYRPYQAIIEKLVKAITGRQQIRFLYTSLQQSEPIPHERVDPYYIVQLEGHFYLIAYNHGENSCLEYRLERIQAESLELLPSLIDVERRRHPTEFRFWLDSRLANAGLSQRWLKQVIEREEAYVDREGHNRRRMLIRATAYNEWRVVRQMLAYGDKVEVIEPSELRERMRQEIARMARLYE